MITIVHHLLLLIYFFYSAIVMFIIYSLSGILFFDNIYSLGDICTIVMITFLWFY